MRFTLVFEGDLPPKANSTQKWGIRRALEPQLRALWQSSQLEGLERFQNPTYLPSDCYVGRKIGSLEFIPLISPKLDLRVELKIILLSASLPGGLVNRSGDLDNRMKTLLDALSVPTPQQLVPEGSHESDGRVFCLLDDDRLIIKLDVSNDRLLTEQQESRRALAIITVRPIAFRATMANIGFTA